MTCSVRHLGSSNLLFDGTTPRRIGADSPAIRLAVWPSSDRTRASDSRSACLFVRDLFFDGEGCQDNEKQGRRRHLRKIPSRAH